MNSSNSLRRIAVLGSINMDLVARCAALPVPGQTLSGTSFTEIPGGKGANQAVGASRAGAAVSMIGCLGDDGFATELSKNLIAEDINCSSVRNLADTASGVAMIVVSDSGENQITVVPGANAFVSRKDVDRNRLLIQNSDVLLLQLEVPLDTVLYAISNARFLGTRVLLDPAPAPLDAPDELFDVDLICPNVTEAEAMTGQKIQSIEDVELAAQILAKRGARAVAITMGDKGTALLDEQGFVVIDPFPTQAVDSTAAGDGFAGAVAVHWAETGLLRDAIARGNAAGSIAASNHGAQPSMATRAEIDQRLKQATQNT